MHYVCTTWVLKSTARHWHWTSLQNAQQRRWNVLSCFCIHIFMLCTELLTVAWFQVRNMKWEFLIHSHIYATAFYWLCCNRSTAQKIFEYYKPGNQTALHPYLLWNPNSKQLTTANISPCWYCANAIFFLHEDINDWTLSSECVWEFCADALSPPSILLISRHAKARLGLIHTSAEILGKQTASNLKSHQFESPPHTQLKTFFFEWGGGSGGSSGGRWGEGVAKLLPYCVFPSAVLG